MGKKSFTVSLLSLFLDRSIAGRTYECSYMKAGSLITQTEMTLDAMVSIKQNFPNSADCRQVATRCTFGPDDAGEFIFDQVVPDGSAARCDKDFCVCTSHENYHRIVAQRIAAAESKLEKPGTDEQADTEP